MLGSQGGKALDREKNLDGCTVNDETETLRQLHRLLSSPPSSNINRTITTLCLKIIKDPKECYIPILFKLLHMLFNPLWVELASFKCSFMSLNEIHLPIELEDELLLRNVVTFNYILLSLIVCIRRSEKPIEFPQPLIIGLLALTKSKVLVTRLLTSAMLIMNSSRPEYGNLNIIILPVVLELLLKMESASTTSLLQDEEMLYTFLPYYTLPIFLLKSLIEKDSSIIHTIIENNYVDIINNSVDASIDEQNKKFGIDSLSKLSCSISILTRACKIAKECCDFIATPHIGTFITTTLTRHLNMSRSWKPAMYMGDHSINYRYRVYRSSQMITEACCDLLVAFSRSGKILRTFIKDIHVTDLLNEYLKLDIHTIPQVLKDNDIRIRVILLSVSANIIVEFSSSLKTFKTMTNIVNSAFAFILDSTTPVSIKERSLWIIKNSLFTDSLEFKENVLNQMPYSLLFDLNNSEETSIKKQTFDIMRNILSISSENVNLLASGFNNSHLPSTGNYHSFFDFLGVNLIHFESLSKIHNELTESCQRILQTLLYLLVHLSAGDSEIKATFITEPKLMNTLKVILDRSILGFDKTYEWDYKTAVALVIINLINPNEKYEDHIRNSGNTDNNSRMDMLSNANNNDSSYSNPETRRELLRAEHFDSSLSSLCETTDDIDFQEKARLAAFRLSIGLNSDSLRD